MNKDKIRVAGILKVKAEPKSGDPADLEGVDFVIVVNGTEYRIKAAQFEDPSHPGNTRSVTLSIPFTRLTYTSFNFNEAKIYNRLEADSNYGTLPSVLSKYHVTVWVEEASVDAGGVAVEVE